MSPARPGRKRTISSLRYFAPAVEAAWEEVAELTAGGEGRAPAPPLEVGQRLAALAAELPATLPEREHLAARILALAGAPEVVEAELARLDDVLLTAAENALKPDQRQRLAEETGAAMEEWRRRLPPDAVAAAADRLRRQTVRRRLGLPVLSLFAAPPESD